MVNHIIKLNSWFLASAKHRNHVYCMDTTHADAAPGQSHTNPRPPNFIFILADDLGYGDVGYNGGRAHTPHIDTLSRGPHSARFNRFYSGAPVCTPTRGTLLTGRNHNRYCLWKANTPGKKCRSRSDDFNCPAQVLLPDSEITVAEILQKEGYRTAVFGKWHLGDLKQLPGGKLPSSPGNNGFDAWKVTERSAPTSTPNCACFDKSLCNLGHYSSISPPPCTNYHSRSPGSDTLTAHVEPILKDDSEFVVDLFEEFLQDVVSSQETKPFFVYLPLHGVHQRFIATSPYDSPYKNNLTLSTEEIDYFATVTAIDSAVGRVRDMLKAYNLSDNTMLWFASDNGPENGTPGETGGLRDRKGSLHEGGIRVPGIIEYPALMNTNLVSDIPIITNDFLPTVCDVLNIPVPTDRPLDGISILPFLSKDAEKRNSTIKWAFKIKGDFNQGRYSAAILDDNYKLVANYSKGIFQKAALYDLSVDKSEQSKINFLLNYKEMSMYTKLTKELEEWRQSVEHSASECLKKQDT